MRFNGKSEQVFNTLLVFTSAFAVVLNSHDGSFPPVVAKAHFKGSTVEVGMGIPSLFREPAALLARLTKKKNSRWFFFAPKRLLRFFFFFFGAQLILIPNDVPR